MIAAQSAQDAIAENLANAGTNGYKQDVPRFQSFQDTLLERMTDGSRAEGIGGLGGGARIQQLATDFSDGGLQQTGNPLDVALTGDAFLAVQTPQGVRYTRDGSLTRSAQGLLVQANGNHPVLGADGRTISLPTNAKDIAINAAGEIRADGRLIGRFQLASISRATGSVKMGDNLFSQAQARPASSGSSVRQGFLEASNVSVVKAMVAMITIQRAYETNQKMIQAEDSATGKAMNEVAKI